MFAVFDQIYHEGENLADDVLFKMSSQSMTELLLMCVLAPVLQSDLRASAAPVLYMLDASPFGGGICKTELSAEAISELWRHTEQRGYYTKLQQGASMALQELGLEPEPTCGEEGGVAMLDMPVPPVERPAFSLHDRTVIYDCVELFSGFGNWSWCHSDAGLRVHPGVERSATGSSYGDLMDRSTFQTLSQLAYQGAIREWHAGPPCWSFGTLRRPRLRSKQQPQGFDMHDPQTREQTLLAVRTAFLLALALQSGCFVSCEQPGSSVMFELHAFKVLLELGCIITKFSFCSFGAGFQKPSKWLHNKPWYKALEGRCSCPYKNRHFTVQGSFTQAALDLFRERCQPDIVQVYGREPALGEAVSSFSASYPLPLCKRMAAGSKIAHAAVSTSMAEMGSSSPAGSDLEDIRPWHEEPPLPRTLPVQIQAVRAYQLPGMSSVQELA